VWLIKKFVDEDKFTHIFVPWVWGLNSNSAQIFEQNSMNFVWPFKNKYIGPNF